MKYEIINNNPLNLKIKYWIEGTEYYLHSTKDERYVLIDNQKYRVANNRVIPKRTLDEVTMRLLTSEVLTSTDFEMIANPTQEKKPSKTRRSPKT